MDKSAKYGQWFPQKIQLDNRKAVPSFRERDIWWCQLGVNVGYELFGHDEKFTRPVLVFRKFSKYTFLAAPLSTAKAKYDFHVAVKIAGREGVVRLDQMRTLDARRLVGEGRMALMPPAKFDEIRQIFINDVLK